jgi:hypothetical protein
MIFLENSLVIRLVKKFPEYSLPCSQNPVIGPYLEPIQGSPNLLSLILKDLFRYYPPIYALFSHVALYSALAFFLLINLMCYCVYTLCWSLNCLSYLSTLKRFVRFFRKLEMINCNEFGLNWNWVENLNDFINKTFHTQETYIINIKKSPPPLPFF